MPEPRRVRSSLGQEPPLDALDVRDVVRAVYDEDEIGEKTKRKKKIQFPGAVSLASTCKYYYDDGFAALMRVVNAFRLILGNLMM